MNNYTYMTLLSDDSYLYGVILLNKSLKDTNTIYPLEVLVTSNVSLPVLNILEQLNLKYNIVDALKSDEMTEFNCQINNRFAKTWHLCMTKFKIFSMTQFDKIVYLDADILVMKNLDHLFECPHLTSALDGEYFNLWPDDPHLNAGILVVKPDINEYNSIIKFATENVIQKWSKMQCIADQEILNLYFKDWPSQQELHLNKYYDVFAPYTQEEQIEDLEQNCYFIHYVGRKPWRAFQKLNIEEYTEYFYTKAHELIQIEVNQLDWNIAQSMVKIAIYGICKNEIENIEKYIECFSKADYLCLLDTGSTDGTWEFLQEQQKKYSNLIIQQTIIDPWRYDTARNLSLTLVPQDTTLYFMVDLDEIIKTNDWLEMIRKSWSPLILRMSYTYNRQVDPETDMVVQCFTEYRIHTNAWHYEGIVHEQLCDITHNRSFYSDECVFIPIAVWHYPTHPNRESYVELCEQGIKEEPANWLMHLQLAAEYEVHEMYDKAINEYKKIIIESDNLSNVEIGRCYASLGRCLNLSDKKEEALQVLKKGRDFNPTCGDNYFVAAEITYDQGNYEETFNLCDLGLKMADENQWCTIVARESYYPFLLMGLSKYYLNDKIEAIVYTAIAREKNNNEEINSIFNTMLSEITNGR